jgi:DHA2 family multidrug resistance protein-like MFS transporter
VSVLSIVVGLAVGIMFVLRQLRSPEPMIDMGLFRITKFNAALVTNFLAIFVAVGYFLYVAQYLQLIVGLSPLEAGLWSLPSAVGFIVGSQFAPRVLHGVRPAYVIAGGLALAGVGLYMLAQVGVSDGLPTLVGASLIISLGLAPVFGLTTELIVGSAPPEQAGAASGISETGSELGGALGIAALGSVGVAIYRGQLANQLPADIPAEAASLARDTLGTAVAAAAELPGQLAEALRAVAFDAFVRGMQVASYIAVVLAVALIGLVLLLLRDEPPPAEQSDEEAEKDAASVE